MKRPTNVWKPEGYNQQGQEVGRVNTELPGIEVEVTPYITGSDVKGPASQHRFPGKKFLQDGLAELKAIENPNAQVTQAISNLETTLSEPGVIWAEDVLSAAQLGSLENLWDDIFSDALDQFPTWKEPEALTPGSKLALKQMQWDARLPYESAKLLQLRVGMYRTKKVDGVLVEVGEPTVKGLDFEDAATKAQRIGYNNQIQSRIDSLTAEIAALPDGTTKTQKQAEKERFENELLQREAVEIGELGKLLVLPAVSNSLPKLLLAIIAAVDPDVDMATVQQRLGMALSTIK